jgi:hypothetical protein
MYCTTRYIGLSSWVPCIVYHKYAAKAKVETDTWFYGDLDTTAQDWFKFGLGRLRRCKVHVFRMHNVSTMM